MTATPRKEVRGGRSFDSSEFGANAEQVIAATAPASSSDTMFLTVPR